MGKTDLDRWVRAAFVTGAADEAVAAAAVAAGAVDSAAAGSDD